jgi:CO/xanthine dehydrogenase Mo-binding subunit
MALDQPRKFKYVGTRPARPDGIDKVTGRAQYGNDITAPGMLWAHVLRSPHAHARIVSIDTTAAAALPGVRAIVTGADFPAIEDDAGMRDVQLNCMATTHAWYEGHAVAAVAATSQALANKAARLIKVVYEVLPHVTDVDAAMAAGAPVVREGQTMENVPAGMSANVTYSSEFGHGEMADGFAKADLVIERTFRTAATHQGYIEPQACLASMTADGRGELWTCTQGHFYFALPAPRFWGSRPARCA